MGDRRGGGDLMTLFGDGGDSTVLFSEFVLAIFALMAGDSIVIFAGLWIRTGFGPALIFFGSG